MARLAPVDPRVMDRVLRKLGFARVRQRGSHVFYRHPGGRTTTVPHHKGRDLAALLALVASPAIGWSTRAKPQPRNPAGLRFD